MISELFWGPIASNSITVKKIPRINYLLNLENCDRIYDGSYVVPMLDNNNNSSLIPSVFQACYLLKYWRVNKCV